MYQVIIVGTTAIYVSLLNLIQMPCSIFFSVFLFSFCSPITHIIVFYFFFQLFCSDMFKFKLLPHNYFHIPINSLSTICTTSLKQSPMKNIGSSSVNYYILLYILQYPQQQKQVWATSNLVERNFFLSLYSQTFYYCCCKSIFLQFNICKFILFQMPS